jgi:hypothetical protein
VTASNPFVRLVEAGGEVVAASFKYGEKLLLGISGRERAEVEAELRQAKAVGQFTILMASAKAKGAINDLVHPEATAPSEPETPTVTTDDAVVDLDAPTCIEEYDSLTASQIVALLSELSHEERGQVLAYENANRGRNSILKELARLA